MKSYNGNPEIQATEEQIIFFEKLKERSLKKRYIPIGQLTIDEWLILRSIVGVGSSEIATALGFVPPWFNKTPLKIWKEKVGHIMEVIDTPIMRIGRNMEEAIVQEYEYLSGRKVLRVKDKMFLHKDYDFLFTDLDGVILPAGGDGYGILEAKSTVSYVYDSWKSKLPSYYFRQSMGELSVFDDLTIYGNSFDTSEYKNCNYVEFATLILDKREVEILRIERDQKFIEVQNEEISKWYEEYVLNNIPPPESASEWTTTDPSIGSFIEASEKGYNTFCDFVDIKRQQKELEEREQEVRDELVKEIKDSENLMYGGEIIATYKMQNRTTINSKKLKAEQPEIYSDYSETSNFRVLRPKIIKTIEY